MNRKLFCVFAAILSLLAIAPVSARTGRTQGASSAIERSFLKAAKAEYSRVLTQRIKPTKEPTYNKWIYAVHTDAFGVWTEYDVRKMNSLVSPYVGEFIIHYSRVTVSGTRDSENKDYGSLDSYESKYTLTIQFAYQKGKWVKQDWREDYDNDYLSKEAKQALAKAQKYNHGAKARKIYDGQQEKRRLLAKIEELKRENKAIEEARRHSEAEKANSKP